MNRTGLYVRVSTLEQTEGYSIDEQIERLTAYCTARGWEISEIYVDAGFSGSTLERPAIEQLIADAKAKKIDTVLVYKLDRLSRSQKDTLFLIEDIFLPREVNFVSVQESFDTSTAFGRAMVGILSVFAQLEREQIKERTYMGRIGRAKKGHWHGGGTHPIGYDYIEGELVINNHEAQQVKKVFELYAAGYSVSEIQSEMKGYTTKHGSWEHTSTIGNVLDNPLYAGIVHFGDVNTPESHDSIISTRLYHDVKKLREAHARARYQQKETEHLLTGLVYCKRCGARYFARKRPSGNIYYMCHSRAKCNRKMIKDPSCKNESWLKSDLEGKVLEAIDNLNLHDLLQKKRAAGEYGSNSIAAQEEIDAKIKKTMALYQNDQIPVEEVESSIKILYNQKSGLSSGNNESDFYRSYNIEKFKSLLSEFKAAKERNEDFICRKLLPLMVGRIEIDGENIYIDWIM